MIKYQRISIHSAIASGDDITKRLETAKYILIHSAIASGDPGGYHNGPKHPGFQSTPPSLAETDLPDSFQRMLKISIHSAIASGDTNLLTDHLLL